jgi:MYXO-CTERM domain-containing protein
MVRQLAAGIFPAVFLGLVVVLGLPFGAKAGPVEELVQLAVNPADPDMMVVRFEYSGDGLLYTKDGGRTFSFVCGSSVSDPSTEQGPLQKLGPIGVGGDGKVLLGVFGGLFRDDGKGCSWTREGILIDRWVTDIVAHPSDPGIAFLITSNGGDAENGIIRRNADGTFTELGAKKPMLISRLRVVELPDGGLRFYESVVLGQIPVTEDGGVMTTKPNYAIRYSDDEGETWTEHELGVLDGPMRLEGVDPSNPDRIVISVSRDRTMMNVPLADSVMVSSDRGETFEEWTEVTEFGGIAFASDGEVWIGDSGDTSTPNAPRGILHATSVVEVPDVLTSAYPVNCLQLAGDALLVCQRFAFGRASLDDGAFTPALELSKLETMNQCEGTDTVAVCRQQLCTGLCGTGHFAQAPMCKASYDSNEERGCAPVGGQAGSGVVGGASGVGGGASGGTGGAGTGGAAASGGDGDGDGDAGAEEPAPKAKSGCACAAAGARGSRAGDFVAFGALGLVALLAQRSRRRERAVRARK